MKIIDDPVSIRYPFDRNGLEGWAARLAFDHALDELKEMVEFSGQVPIRANIADCLRKHRIPQAKYAECLKYAEQKCADWQWKRTLRTRAFIKNAEAICHSEAQKENADE